MCSIFQRPDENKDDGVVVTIKNDINGHGISLMMVRTREIRRTLNPDDGGQRLTRRYILRLLRAHIPGICYMQVSTCGARPGVCVCARWRVG